MSRNLFLAGLSAALTSAQININPSGSFTQLGHGSDPTFGDFISDGGAGGFINGQHLVSLSDASLKGQFPSAHSGYATLDPNDPTKLTIIGNYGVSPPDFWHGVPSGTGGGIINSLPEDGSCQDACFSPAPHVAPIPIPGNSTGALCVWPIHPNDDGPYVYNTMFEMNVLDAATLNNDRENIPAVRTVPVLFNVSEGPAGYGSVALAQGRDADVDSFYLLEGDSTGIKIARAPWASRTDKTSWDYFRGAEGWQRDEPLNYNTDAFGNMFNVSFNLQFGVDFRFVEHFNTWILTMSNGNGLDSSMYITYSTSGKPEGPYADLQPLFQPVVDPDCQGLTDFPQAHWDYYGTDAGKLLVSWVSCTTFTNFGVVTWNS